MTKNRIYISFLIRRQRLRNFLEFNFHYVKLSKIIKVISDLPDYPSIAATPSQFLDIYQAGAKLSLEELANICSLPELDIKNIRDFIRSEIEFDEATLALKADFERLGSDKGRSHEYYLLYSHLLSSFEPKSAILEIGLGTNDVSTPSNMGILGQPGASLRTWILQEKIACVVGADIDESTLFKEPGIETYQLNQTSHLSWLDFKNKLGDRKFDLIVDDGLHSPYANLVTISESLDLLTKSGKIVVEDIHERHLPIWRLFMSHLPVNFEATLIRCRKAIVLLIERKLEDKEIPFSHE